jgi:hypothetical protein
MKNLPPQSRGPDSWTPCFIKFRATDQERFQILIHAFEILKQEKLKYLAEIFEDDGAQENNNHEQALRKLVEVLFDLFDEQALAHFWWPSKQEHQDYWQRWSATPVPQRFTDPALKTPWDFESMIDSFLNGEYELLSCRLLTSDTGVLEFLPFSFPYGGTGCMKALSEALDFQVIGEDDGTGYVSCL